MRRAGRVGLLLGLVLLLAGPHRTAAQDSYTVRGVILDAGTDNPLPGANVRLENTTIGTAADVEGNYSLTIPRPPGTYTLQYTFVGYKPVERTVTFAGETTVEMEPVSMEIDVLEGEEIVVTGTGVPTERKKLGNSISSVDAQDIQLSGASAIDQALSGKIPGALVQQNSGNPAGGISVSLRGASTVLGSGEPLYIVDGVIVNNDSPELIDLGGGSQNRLVDLNPDDIERIEVVKGAAAAALYGSRANNGVVQIFTKRGQQGRPRVNFKNTVRTDAVRKTLEVNTFPFDGPASDTTRQPVERFDFQDFIFQRAYGTEQYLSITGGAPATNYAISGAHFVNEGVVKGNLFRRLNGRARLQQSLNDWLSLRVGANFTSSTSDDVPNGGLSSNYGALTGFIFGPNTFDPRPENGEYPNQGILANPVEVIDRFDFNQETQRFIGDVQVNLTPIDNLDVDYIFGYDTYDQVALAFIPRGTSAPGLGEGFSRRSTRASLQLNNDLNIRYQTDLAEGLASTTLLGGTHQYETVENFSAQSQDLTPIAEVVQSGTSARDFGEFRSEVVIYGVFAQQTLDIFDRLFLTAAGRFDAASVFGEGERWQFYPKASLSYLLSEQGFWQDSPLGTYLPSLKLRAAYGESGGLTAIDAFTRFTNYNPEAYGGNPGLVPSSQLGALDVKPERQREFELGFDLGLLNDRLAVEFTYYDQRTEDLLLTRSLDPSSGFLSRLQNVGTLDNVGIEVLLRALPFNQRNFRWTSTVTYAANENEVDGLEEETLILGGFGLVAAKNNEPLGIYFGSAFERNAEGKVVNDEGQPLERGDDGFFNGIPARAAEPKKIGDPNPDFSASWINEFEINRNLTVRAQIDAVVGQDVFNFTRRLASLFVFGTLEDYQRELEGELPEGYNARVFGIFENWVEDGSFVKLREVTAAYTFYPERLPLRDVRVSLTGRNLFSIDDYSGYDPETNIAGQSNTVRGFDFVEVPIPRTFSLSVNLGF